MECSNDYLSVSRYPSAVKETNLSTITSRISNRDAVWMEGYCITRLNRKFQVGVTDLSAEGCRIALRGKQIGIFEPVAIRFEGLEALEANVVWVAHDYAGLQFNRPLYGPVVDHYIRQHGATAAPQMQRQSRN